MNDFNKDKAFRLLRNLEDDNYIISESDKILMNHEYFKVFRNNHVKKLVDRSFFRALRGLLDNKVLSYDDFSTITKPSSNWYRQKFIESFYYHCSNPAGQFYDLCKGKSVKKDIVTENSNSQLEKCFTCE